VTTDRLAPPRVASVAAGLLANEAAALLTRLDQLRPFVLSETMVLAAALPYRAHRAIERFLHERRVELRHRVRDFLYWLGGPGAETDAAEQQRRFVAIRMGFNDVLSQLDLFAEVITQRSEAQTGVWLSGLDRLAADALTVPEQWIPDPPPLICYLARGPGAAIRRARTRLPGGQPSPVGILRIPRERMIGHGVASSVVHEVGHQAAALLDLVEPLRTELTARARGRSQRAWTGWANTVSECIADFWSVAKLGVSSTLGLLGVVSLPRFFVFRPPGVDPHPMPYVRVMLSAAVGNLLYPHQQWEQLAQVWQSYYPAEHLDDDARQVIAELVHTAPAMAESMAEHRPKLLRGHTLADILVDQSRRPEALLASYDRWDNDIGVLSRQPPTLVFAAVGQARAAGRIEPATESSLLANVLTTWAMRSSIDVLERDECRTPPSTISDTTISDTTWRQRHGTQ